MTTPLRLAFPLLFAILLCPAFAPVEAQSANDDRARELYLRGDRLYNEGRYEESITAFQEAYRLSQRPLLLFNLANAYERLGRYEEALRALRQYAPTAPVEEESQIRARIQNLERRAEEAVPPGSTVEPDPGPQPDPGPGPQPVTPTEGGPDVALLGAGAAVAGVGVALAVTGAVFGALALDARAEVEPQCTEIDGGTLCRAEAGDAISRDETYALIADIGIPVGAAAVAGGLVLMIVGATSTSAADSAAQPSAQPVVSLGPSGAEVGIVGTF